MSCEQDPGHSDFPFMNLEVFVKTSPKTKGWSIDLNPMPFGQLSSLRFETKSCSAGSAVAVLKFQVLVTTNYYMEQGNINKIPASLFWNVKFQPFVTKWIHFVDRFFRCTKPAISHRGAKDIPPQWLHLWCRSWRPSHLKRRWSSQTFLFEIMFLFAFWTLGMFRISGYIKS